jgi:hypothetical protein
MPDETIFIVNNGEYFRITGIAIEVFNLLIQENSSEQIISILSKRFPENEKTLQKEIKLFIADLKRLGIFKS